MPDTVAYSESTQQSSENDTALLVLPARHRVLLGSTNPPVLPGYKDVGGQLIDSPAGTQWSLSELTFGVERILTLDSLTHVVGRRAHWITVAAMLLPPLADSNEAVVPVDCALDGRPDASIVALGRWIDSGPHLEDLTDIRAAFRPVVSQRGFEVLPVRRVSCWVDEDRN
ncbi:MAG: hypothetical protein U0974_06145 [Gemmatimonadales bacterium]|nr:hypothetical protein [Gemmatimonadales bacterium]MDZ4389292.1 hypothetical protein [Gemmatimonadales bacterium]